MNLSHRLKSLERKHAPTGRIVTVFGADAGEHAQQIALVEAVIGERHPSELTVCIRTFAGGALKAPLLNGRPLEVAA